MYQALYRKYRPQTFSDVVGQRSVTDTLRNQLISGKLSHAYLFTGTRGTGKTSCAKILAKAVNCLDLQDGNPCNRCTACRAIDSGSCMDVLEIDAASNNGVDSVRVLRDDAVYTPSEVKMRVYIVDEVHMLSTAAFNALLKIIEEPPEHLLFILATTELHKVPATILSRCQRFAFRRLTPEDIASRLNYIAYEEGIDIEPEGARLLARLADGALRDGVSLLDQVASSTGGAVTAESVYAALGLAGQRRTGELLRAVGEQNAAAALKIFSELYAGGKDIAAMLDELTALCRDLLVMKTAPKGGLAMLSGLASEEDMTALGEIFSGGELLRCITLLQTTKGTFAQNADSRVATELCLMQMCQPELSMDVQSLSARISRVEEQIAAGVVVRRAKAQTPADPDDDERPPLYDDADAPPEMDMPAAPMAAPEAVQRPEKASQAAEDNSFWPELSARVREGLHARDKGFFMPGGPISASLKGDTLYLAAETEFVLDMIKRPEIEALIREKAAAVLKRPVAVKLGLKNQMETANSDFMDNLARLGQEHTDIFTIR